MVAAALYFAVPIIAATLIYGTFSAIVVGLIVSEYRARPRPSIANIKQLRKLEAFSQEEASALATLKGQQDQFRRLKTGIYRRGDQSGLKRRQSDGRFNAARGEGHALNNRLAKLDFGFSSVADEIMEIELRSANRHQQLASEFTEWQFKRNLAIAFRTAVVAYIGCAVVLAFYNWRSLQQVSQLVAQHIWPYIAVLAGLYGPLAFASIISIITFLLLNSIVGVHFTEVDTSSVKEKHDHETEIFRAAEAESALDDPDPSPDADLGAEAKNAESRSPYEILGVPINATCDQIMTAYRELIKQYHPDFQQNRGAKLRELAEYESQLLNWAKEEALKHC